MVDYDRAGQERRDLAQKIIYAQLALAKAGFSTGGRPPYGFRRWLVAADGAPVRQLAEGERVRMAGHHVVWFPGPAGELDTIRRILGLLEAMPATRVAALLTADGVPTPDAGRQRTDKGVSHPTSGVWRQQQVVAIARNPLLRAVVEYGRRSMGDRLRFSPEGPRELGEEDVRQDGRPRVVANPEAARVTAAARFDPPVDPERHGRLLRVLDERGGSQRGRPRSQDPARNPLGGRVYDLGCGWPMYRQPHRDSFRYACGLYQQSHGARCRHNHVDGPAAACFLLQCVWQRVLAPGLRQRLEAKLRALAERERGDARPDAALADKRAALAEARRKLELAGQNLALAEGPDQRRAVAAVFDRLKGQEWALEAEVRQLEQAAGPPRSADAEVAAALAVLDRMAELAAEAEDLAAAGRLFSGLNARLFFRFAEARLGRRVVNKVAGGVVTFGDAPPPVALYEGPTGRRYVKGPGDPVRSPGPGPHESPGEPGVVPGGEGDSSGNVSRGDWIRTSDLLNPILLAARRNGIRNREMRKAA
jgi:hypothetical protein